VKTKKGGGFPTFCRPDITPEPHPLRQPHWRSRCQRVSSEDFVQVITTIVLVEGWASKGNSVRIAEMDFYVIMRSHFAKRGATIFVWKWRPHDDIGRG
jgi:hypothetical protein